MSDETPTRETTTKDNEPVPSEPVSPSATAPIQDTKIDENKPNKINVTVKTQRQKEVFQVDPDVTITEFKELISPKFEADVARLNLIFAGKIMKNEDTLSKHNVKDGLTVHLVIRAAAPSTSASTESTQATNTSQANSLGGGLLGLGVSGQNFVELQQRLQQELQSNPNLLQHLLQNPLTQVLMNDPENMRQLILNNPQMQQVIEQNPEISHLLNNRDLLRQTMDVVRNPAAFQEMLRTQDRAMANIESLPGGFQALERIYHDIQEPMLNNLTEQLAQNPFVRLANNTTNNQQQSNQQPNQPNREPLPNPWSTTPRNQSPSATPTLPSLQLLQQMSQNTDLMQTFFNTPYAQEIMTQLSSNPAMMTDLMQNNPLFGGQNTDTQDLQNAMPHLMHQLQIPEMQNVATNQEALNAILQIQEGLNILRQNAPSLINPDVLVPPAPNNGSTTPDSTSTPIITQANQSTTSVTTTTTTTPAQQTTIVDTMARILSNMSSVPPEQRYQTQLSQLEVMGFTNRQRNLQVLIETFGNIEAAIERLLMNSGN